MTDGPVLNILDTTHESPRAQPGSPWQNSYSE
jgi:hypothetical protein